MIAHEQLPFRRLEDGNDADRLLFPTDSVPGDPDAVGGAEIRDTVALGKLFWCENKFPLRLVSLAFVIECVDYQFALGWNSLMSLIVEVDTSAETSCRLIVCAINDHFAPNGDEFGGPVSGYF